MGDLGVNPFDEVAQQRLPAPTLMDLISGRFSQQNQQREEMRQKSADFAQQQADYMKQVMDEKIGIMKQKKAEGQIMSNYFSGKSADEIDPNLFEVAGAVKIPGGKKVPLPQTPEQKAQGLEGGYLAPDRFATFGDLFNLGDTDIEKYYSKIPFLKSVMPSFIQDMQELTKTKLTQEGLNKRQGMKNDATSFGLRSALVTLGAQTTKSLQDVIEAASNAKALQDSGDMEGYSFALGDLGKKRASFRTTSNFYNSQVSGIKGVDPLPELPEDANDPDTILKYFSVIQPTVQKNQSLWDRMFNRDMTTTPGNPSQKSNPAKAPPLATNGQNATQVETKKSLPTSDGYNAEGYLGLITSEPYNLSASEAKKVIDREFPDVAKKMQAKKK